ncbi:hypothetical protein XH94_10985 [Bradyrhizobium zhanjiangense]|uniref:Uncharacterized protein n=1 Tax=Bradyrhizobium zhanjiangense TaxID=1325107 RepID=A0A4Q0SRS9_9BRAD|nr:hypothetical protein XH94_10985 [Bradyrhizobium zhanjiangense]
MTPVVVAVCPPGTDFGREDLHDQLSQKLVAAIVHEGRQEVRNASAFAPASSMICLGIKVRGRCAVVHT